jgi:hypothetical protein
LKNEAFFGKRSNHMNIEELEKQEKAILQKAQKAGLSDSYLFCTTFDRYKTQVRMCIQLKEQYEDMDVLITKEYVKGRENLYTNPVIKEFNSTSSAANKTAETLMKLIKSASDTEASKPKKDPLLDALRG